MTSSKDVAVMTWFNIMKDSLEKMPDTPIYQLAAPQKKDVFGWYEADRVLQPEARVVDAREERHWNRELRCCCGGVRVRGDRTAGSPTGNEGASAVGGKDGEVGAGVSRLHGGGALGLVAVELAHVAPGHVGLGPIGDEPNAALVLQRCSQPNRIDKKQETRNGAE